MLRRRPRPRPRPRPSRWAEVFADDLVAGCEQLFGVFGGDVVSLPISIPIDEHGIVLLQPQGPLHAPRVPASLTLARRAGGAGDDAYEVRIERLDGGSMIVPGLGDALLPALTFVVASDGLEVGPGPLPIDEVTARALATALLITIRTKLAKAKYEGGGAG